MLYREIIDVYSQIHTKHINTLCGQNVELLNVKLAVHIVPNCILGFRERKPVLASLNMALNMCVRQSECLMLRCAVCPQQLDSCSFTGCL